MRTLLFILFFPCLALAQYAEEQVMVRVYMRNHKVTRIVVYQDVVRTGSQIEAKSTTETSIGRPQFSAMVEWIGVEVDTSKSLDYTLAALRNRNIVASKPGTVSVNYPAKNIKKPLLYQLVKAGYSLAVQQQQVEEPMKGF